MITLLLLNTRSGVPGSSRTWTRKRSPAACRYRRTVHSGAVSRPLIPDIMRDRVVGLTLSVMCGRHSVDGSSGGRSSFDKWIARRTRYDEVRAESKVLIAGNKCMARVPLIDLFAGPGGLGEGFSRAESVKFQVAVSIEKDGMAFETLQLRAAHRALQRAGPPKPAIWRRWDSVLADAPWNIAFEMLRASGDSIIAAACEEARREAWNLEL